MIEGFNPNAFVYFYFQSIVALNSRKQAELMVSDPMLVRTLRTDAIKNELKLEQKAVSQSLYMWRNTPQIKADIDMYNAEKRKIASVARSRQRPAATAAKGKK